MPSYVQKDFTLVSLCNNEFTTINSCNQILTCFEGKLAVLYKSFFQEYRVSISRLTSHRFCLYSIQFCLSMGSHYYTIVYLKKDVYKYILNALAVSKH